MRTLAALASVRVRLVRLAPVILGCPFVQRHPCCDDSLQVTGVTECMGCSRLIRKVAMQFRPCERCSPRMPLLLVTRLHTTGANRRLGQVGVGPG